MFWSSQHLSWWPLEGPAPQTGPPCSVTDRMRLCCWFSLVDSKQIIIRLVLLITSAGFLCTHMFQLAKHFGKLLFNILAWNFSCSMFPSCHSWCSNLRINGATERAASITAPVLRQSTTSLSTADRPLHCVCVCVCVCTSDPALCCWAWRISVSPAPVHAGTAADSWGKKSPPKEPISNQSLNQASTSVH